MHFVPWNRGSFPDCGHDYPHDVSHISSFRISCIVRITHELMLSQYAICGIQISGKGGLPLDGKASSRFSCLSEMYKRHMLQFPLPTTSLSLSTKSFSFGT